ncbi:retrovirus-related pol polyprotein from transposon TNT 1-94 [Tanacetum coccineum]
MSNIEKIKFSALDITRANYIQWTGNVKRHLKSMGALATLQKGNKCSDETKAKVDVFLHQHVDEMLEFKYSNYMLEKTFSTFHASNINLQQQYRLQNFKRYSDLNVNLLVTEKNNELLMKNHQTRPTGSLALPEANFVNNNDNKNSGSKRERGNPRGRGRGRGHHGHNRFPNINYTYHRGGYNGRGRGRGRSQRNNTYHAPQVNNLNQQNNEVGTSQNPEGSCFRCGSTNYWSKACRMPLHLCELYQASRKGKEKEVNHVDQFDNTNTELIASDFFNDLDLQKKSCWILMTIYNNYKFKMSLNGAQYQAKDGELCIADSGATHTILKSNKYFFELKPTKGTIDTISGPTNLIDGVGKANVVLGHPGSTMMKKIVENTHGHPLKDQKFSKIDKVSLCTSCSLGKLIARSSPLKVENESPMFLERIQDDICGLIHPPFKRVRLDNAGEFTSHSFNGYCMSVGIVVEHPVAHVHTQNGLVESLIKRLQLIAGPLIMRTKLLVSMRGHVILHAASLICMRPSANHKYSLIQLASGQEPNISHFIIFGCAVQKRVTKSHIPAANAPARIEIPNKQAGDNITQESQKRLKRGRPIGSKDKNPRKRKGTEKNSSHDENVLDETQDIKTSPEEEMNDINKEMLINYSQTHTLWDRNEIGDIDKIFSYFVASDIMSGDDDPELKSVIDCQSQPDWDKWKDAMQAELNSLNKRKVFGLIVTTPRDVKPIEHMHNGIFIHQSNYTEKLLKRFNMDKAKPLSTPMVGRSLNVDNDPFRPCEDNEEVLGP